MNLPYSSKFLAGASTVLRDVDIAFSKMPGEIACTVFVGPPKTAREDNVQCHASGARSAIGTGLRMTTLLQTV